MKTSTILKILAVPAAIGGYVVVSGLSGFCPTCVRIMDTALGRDASLVALTESGGSIATLSAADLDGNPVSLQQFVGKPTILELWATWCPPCHAQREIMEKLAPELDGKLNVVSLSTDSDSSVVRRHLQSHTPIGTELMATPDIIAAMGEPRGIPALGFVNARGELVEVRLGVQSEQAIKDWIKQGS